MPDVTVTDSSAIVISSKSRRRQLIIQNNDSVDIYYRLGNKTVATSGNDSGILLPANGGTFTLSMGGEANDYMTLPIVAIVATGTATLTYDEV